MTFEDLREEIKKSISLDDLLLKGYVSYEKEIKIGSHTVIWRVKTLSGQDLDNSAVRGIVQVEMFAEPLSLDGDPIDSKKKKEMLENIPDAVWGILRTTYGVLSSVVNEMVAQASGFTTTPIEEQ